MDFALFVQIVINVLTGAVGYFIGTYDGFRKGINRGARSINEVNRELDKLTEEYEADKAARAAQGKRFDEIPMDEELQLADEPVIQQVPIEDYAVPKRGKKTKKGKKANPATR